MEDPHTSLSLRYIRFFWLVGWPLSSPTCSTWCTILFILHKWISIWRDSKQDCMSMFLERGLSFLGMSMTVSMKKRKYQDLTIIDLAFVRNKKILVKKHLNAVDWLLWLWSSIANIHMYVFDQIKESYWIFYRHLPSCIELWPNNFEACRRPLINKLKD